VGELLSRRMSPVSSHLACASGSVLKCVNPGLRRKLSESKDRNEVIAIIIRSRMKVMEFLIYVGDAHRRITFLFTVVHCLF
jgi:hypothetical protein